MTELKLTPENYSEDFASVLTDLAQQTNKEFKHVEIKVPQEYVLTNIMQPYADSCSNLKLNPSSLRNFLSSKACENLETFCLSWDDCIYEFSKKSTDGGKALAPLGNLKSLKAIRMYYPIVNNVDILSSLYAPNLLELSLTDLAIGSTNYDPWSRESCQQITQSIAPLKNLVKLCLSDHFLRDEHLEELLSDKPDLRSLDLSAGFGDNSRNKHNLTDAGLRTIAMLCPDLDSLSLSYQKAPTMTGLEHIITKCSHLRELRVGMKLDSSLKRILPLAKELMLFDIDVGFGNPPRFVYDAIIATGGRVLVMTMYQGLVKLPVRAPPNVVKAQEQSKRTVEELDSLDQDPSIINEWEGIPRRGKTGKCTPESVTSKGESSGAPPTSVSSPACSWHACPRQGQNVKTSACGQCKKVFYCGSGCQKKHWQIHKYKCISVGTPRHEVSEFTIEAIQAAIDSANDGDAIILKEGVYKGASPDTKLVINKPLSILGELNMYAMDKIQLVCSLEIKPSGKPSDAKHKVVLADFQFGDPSLASTVSGSGSMGFIFDNSYKEIDLYNVRIVCGRGYGGDAFTTASKGGGKTVFDDCEIHGGSDGLHIAGPGVHLKYTEIRYAASRGIFSRETFVLEECHVDMCGAYGIKGTAGWTAKGKNHIQPGPW
jgi:hypothetical protein